MYVEWFKYFNLLKMLIKLDISYTLYIPSHEISRLQLYVIVQKQREFWIAMTILWRLLFTQLWTAKLTLQSKKNSSYTNLNVKYIQMQYYLQCTITDLEINIRQERVYSVFWRSDMFTWHNYTVTSLWNYKIASIKQSQR